MQHVELCDSYKLNVREPPGSQTLQSVATVEGSLKDWHDTYLDVEVDFVRGIAQSSRWDLERIGCDDEWHSDPDWQLNEESSEDEEWDRVEIGIIKSGCVPFSNVATPSDCPPPESAVRLVISVPYEHKDIESSSSLSVATPDTSPAAVQPRGTWCIVICRLSSWSAAEKWYTNDKNQNIVARGRLVAELQRDGTRIAQRLERNCASPWRFDQVEATAHKYLGDSFNNFTKTDGRPPESVLQIRAIFDKMASSSVATATVVIRAVDGLTILERTFLSFLQMAKARSIRMQLIFQYVKVYDNIRPLKLQPSKGLGSVLVLDSDECLNHLLKVPGCEPADVQRLLDIWDHLREEKNKGKGIQDRNTLPGSDQLRAVEATAGGKLVGRHCIGRGNKLAPPGKGKGKRKMIL